MRLTETAAKQSGGASFYRTAGIPLADRDAVIQLLLEHGADPMRREASSGVAPYDTALRLLGHTSNLCKLLRRQCTALRMQPPLEGNRPQMATALQWQPIM